MARTIAVIQQSIIADLVARAAAVGVTITPSEWSDYDFRQLITYVVAVAIATLEQLWDAFTVDTEALVAISAPQTARWIQNFALNIFQYSSATPQVIEFDTVNIVPYYETVDPALRIVTQCAVVPGSLGTSSVKVAKSGPVALSSLEVDALQSAFNTLTVPGVEIYVTSDDPDNIFIGATVTYSGQYSALIPVANGTVVQAIQAFLASVPTTGIVNVNSPVGLMKLTDLIAAVRAVPGVIDFELNDINARQDATAFVPGISNLVAANDWLQNQWNSGLSGAGYMITETTSGYTINDSLTYIAS